MKSRLIFLAIAIVLVVTCAFAFSKQGQKIRKARTIITVHTFEPDDKTQPVEFLEMSVESYKDNGDFVHRKISPKGRNSYFYADERGSYTISSGAQVAEIVDKTRAVLSDEKLAAGEAALAKREGFQRVENVHGLDLSVTERVINDVPIKEWWSYQYGPIQMDRKVNHGTERIRIVAVQDGYNSEEFERIPQLQKVLH